MKEIKILELFGGIGACSKALERLGIEYKIVDYVEIDKYAVKSFNAIHGTNFEPQDICKWDKDVEVDLIMHGSPCQDFSLAGKQAGGDKDSGTRSSLMYETIRIVEKLKPKYVIWENVKNLLSKKHRHNFDAYLETMESLGYTNYYQVLNAKDYGIPQNRERVFTISILGNEKYEFPSKQDEENLQDFLEKDTNIKTKPMCDKAFNIEYEQIITSDKDIYQCNVSSGYQDCKVGIKVSPTIRAGNNCTHILQRFEFPAKEELKTTMHNLLEENVEEKYYLSEKMTKYVTEKNEKSNFKVFRPHYAGEEKIAHTIQTSGGNRADDNFIVFHFPEKQELKLKLKDMLEDEVDEKYYLSDKMIKYISATGTANFRNPDSKINLDIARPLTTDQNKRAGTTNYLSEDLPSNYNLNEVVRKYGIFDTEKSTHQAGSVYDENGLSPTLDTMQGGYRQPCIEIKETTKQGYKTAYEGDGANTSSRMEYQRENVQEQTIQTITTSGGSDRDVVVDKLPGAYGRDFGSKGKIQNKEYCDTLTASMGTGGGNVPIIKDYGLYGNKQAGSVYNKNGLCPTITTEASQNWNILLNDNPKIRKLTPKECWRLMGFDDEDYEKAAFKKETSYIEGGLKCNAKLKIVGEKRRPLDTETYVLCTTNDTLDMETPTQIKWKKSIENENNEKMQNVNIAIEMLGEVEQKECVTNIIKCGENTTILYTLMEELDQHHMAIIGLGKRGKANIEKYMKITLEENLNPMKLYTISILIEQIIKSKIYTCITQKANIQGNIAIIEDCVKNLKMMKLSNLKMEYITRLNSDTMLYKQAGNSIVVNVLEAIFNNLLIDYK